MKTVNLIRIGDTKFRRDICGLCGENAICMILKFRKDGGRWKKMNVCTRCIPLRTELYFGDEYMVMTKTQFRLIVSALRQLSLALVKLGAVIYVTKKKNNTIGKVGVREIAVCFGED